MTKNQSIVAFLQRGFRDKVYAWRTEEQIWERKVRLNLQTVFLVLN